jgi:alpha-tubulin suppressor-like RCC1 family protein
MSQLHFLDLPAEIIVHITYSLDDISTILKLGSTCSQINIYCQDEHLWRMKFRKDFGDPSKPESLTWKEYYKLEYPIEPNPPISAGSDHYGIIDNQGHLHMGGSGWYGQVGGGEKTKKGNNPPTKIELVSKVICISCGDNASGAVTEEGDVYIWGSIKFGEAKKSLYIPTLVPLEKHALKISISVWGYVIILKDHSIYYSLHRPPNINLGIKDGEESGYLADIRVRDIHIENFGFTVVTNKFQVLHFSLTSDDELSTSETSLREPILHILSDGSNNIAVLSSSGNLYVWGDNEYGQLGQDDRIDRNNPTQVRIRGNISYISLGGETMAAVTENGELYMWGSNKGKKIMEKSIARKIGFLGNAGKYVIPAPVELRFPISSTNVKSKKLIYVAIGEFFTMTLTEDGEIKVWGDFPTTLEE